MNSYLWRTVSTAVGLKEIYAYNINILMQTNSILGMSRKLKGQSLYYTDSYFVNSTMFSQVIKSLI